MSSESSLTITEEQFVSLQNLLTRYQDLPTNIFQHSFILDHALEVVYPHIHILIETDGYAHS